MVGMGNSLGASEQGIAKKPSFNFWTSLGGFNPLAMPIKYFSKKTVIITL